MLRKLTPHIAALSLAALIASTPVLAKEKKAKKVDAAATSQKAAPPTDDLAAPPAPADDMAPPASSPMGPPSPGGAPPPPSQPAAPPPDPSMISASKTVVENTSNSPDHTTLLKAVKSAGMADALSAAGPFTLFAPNNAGFDRLPPGTVDALLKPENQGSLSKILNYHVVAGKVTAADLSKKIKSGKGKATVTTLAGNTLTATADGAVIKLTDNNGNASEVVKADILGSNGVIHSINGVLIPGEKKADAPAR
jgi:uncharacterized surface protein with fasciclin (FAS1) repeats